LVDFITKDGKVIAIPKRKGLSSKDLRFKKAQITESKKQLVDADRRLDIALSKMGEITKRVQELEVERNEVLRKELLEKEIKGNPNKKLIAELKKLKVVNERADETFREVSFGYRSMSTRKNSLSEERDSIVKYIEDKQKEIAKDAEIKALVGK